MYFSLEHAQSLLHIVAHAQLLVTSWQQISTAMLLVKNCHPHGTIYLPKELLHMEGLNFTSHNFSSIYFN